MEMINLISNPPKVEKFCPVLPWRQKNATSEQKVATMRLELEDSFINDLTALNLRWIRDRITRMWPHWVKGAKEFEKEGSLRRQHHAKKIFIFLGTYAFQPNWLDRAFTGAPLGEMVQWSDLLASLYILGHDITISDNATTFMRHLTVPTIRGCSDAFMPEFDLIFTDYNGLTYMQMNLIPNLSPYMCRVRILDSFGTDAEFNYASYSEPIPGGKSVWAMAELNLRQILTMFPHSPDNLFLGFVVSAPVPVDAQPLKKKPVGLVYGKDVEFWQGKREYLDTLHKYLEIHGTFFGVTEEEIKKNVPDYVITHGILSKPDLEKLLKETKVFIGLGFPYEGPAPLEAIAQGCIFLNAKFDPPHSRLNTLFFKGKPTLREVTLRYWFIFNIDHSGFLILHTKNEVDQWPTRMGVIVKKILETWQFSVVALGNQENTALNFFRYDIDYCSAHFQLPLSDLRTSFVTCLKRVRTEQF
ncbi:PREDICTED: alpha-1,6-mannosylglycoprotein 6-beta-N-acetylglucosaminyltransferase A-like [Acropora digitifera]|uniref:alpha-1,6-mannosylglycoprotein 6-beta-N-acetylglucosaminyltransferase A-like n=1 Tax=Acropora digitifera TaxID=70779 RepID=UPI00077AB148|nr:PREDICTED: alpha-1,6-mannosylglycoprotein 6-beta-N-acetylglucosaminyltransferase A-like [Acropora digitifera]